jgi:hypothetical protein
LVPFQNSKEDAFVVLFKHDIKRMLQITVVTNLKDIALTGHSSLEKVLTQASSLASQSETRASALPTAKYLPVGSNSMHMQFPG